MKNSSTAYYQRGMTLLEVMVALAIVAFGLIAVFNQLNQGLFSANYTRNKTLATWVGENVITELRLLNQFPEIDTTDDEAEMAGQKWRYKMTVSGTAVPNLRRVEVAVAFADTPERTVATIIGLVGKPATAPAIPSLSSSLIQELPGEIPTEGETR